MATHLRITGLVQGVGYRASFETQARALGLGGWVRNRKDGSVEAMVIGDPEATMKIVAWSKRGPSAARISAVHVSEVDDPSISVGRFDVLPTA